MDDLKQRMQNYYLKYASYVILDRAIPNVIDGLKPVQRRILYTLHLMRDDKLHKVANVVGQTMALHPHGDAPIYEALVTMANKGYLLDRQGNFGNLLTGDPSAAARYIETRLSPLAKETLFNSDLTKTLPSYDGRAQEPVALPSKIPVVLMHGISGIAVGMATHILPHNFVELLEAEIAILEGDDFNLVPDFPTGGIMDAREYEHGKGKIKLRAKIEEKDPKTLVIKDICYGTTTESLIRSIDEAAKKGKIKIEAINDYTAEHVEIEIKLPRGQYANELMDALFAYTECQVSISSQVMVIKDNLPWETDVKEILKYHAEQLQTFLKREMEIEKERLTEKIFVKTLEQIFIENRLYKKIENLRSYEAIHRTIAESLAPYHNSLERIPLEADRERLLNILIRRISQFDIDKNEQDISELKEALKQVEKQLKQVKKYTIAYIKKLLKEYGPQYPRKTQIEAIGSIDRRAIETRTVKVGFDPDTGFVGTRISAVSSLECTNFDKLLLMYSDGTYMVINVPEKQYVLKEGLKLSYVGIADKKTVLSAIYKDPETMIAFAKRFVIDKFIMDKVYYFIPDGFTLEFLTAEPEIAVQITFVPKLKQKKAQDLFDFSQVLVKGVGAKGIRLANRAVKKINQIKNGKNKASRV